MISKNKKGAEKIMSVYWFAILVLIAGGVFVMVSTFHNSPYDIRELEAEIMINQVSDCVSQGGKLNEKLISDSNFNKEFKILEECHLNFNTEFENEIQYYLEINFYNFNDFEDPIYKISSERGVELKADCEIQKEKEYGTISKCVEKTFYSLDRDQNQIFVKILSIVRKTDKNAK